MEENKPGNIYQRQLQKHNATLEQLLEKRTRLGWVRMLVFIATALISFKTFSAYGFIGSIPLGLGLALLVYFIFRDASNNQEIANTKTLISINEEEINTLNHRFHHHFDGAVYAPASHDYANDLDLFGKASLYQWASRCYTEQGRNLLAADLLQPLNKERVLQRHEAVKELAGEIDWRQQLQSLAMQTNITVNTQRKTEAWLDEKDRHFTGKAWKIIVPVYSVITLGSAVAAIIGFIPASLFSSLFVLYFIISIILSRNTVKPYLLLSGIVKEVSALHLLLQWIEDKPFKSAYLQQLQQSVNDKNKAAGEIKKLKMILDRFDLRLSIVGLLFFNSFLLWDTRQMIALNDWRKKNKQQLHKWFDLVAEMEVLNSLASIHFNQALWCFPQFGDVHFTLKGKRVGHPLIPPADRVDNDFDLEGTPKIGLVTGSNMAGKSTFLRSLGVNLVLAQMGAPVCAEEFKLSPVRLMSSMRIADNLAENTSTFYAELKKLKTIIEAVNRDEKVFLLLDEILRGTNSLDRHTGSEALVKQLIHKNAVAVIATHDVELAGLQNQFPKAMENYHFDVQVEGEELYFDYKLKTGVCTSLNASILMKKIGIELSE
jgi:hypothetical protein